MAASKDKILGAVIMVVGIVLIIVYTVIGPLDYYAAGTGAGTWVDTSTAWLRDLPLMHWEWAVILPLWLVVVLVGIIAAWIGISMITTPPPVPLEELEEELEAEEAGSA